jgi:endonuclease/exonuclease/phosphatase family metal-dependent hydrolase
MLRVGTWNVLYDKYVNPEWYQHVPPELLVPGARQQRIREVVESLNADVVGLQEAGVELYHEFARTGEWIPLWTPNPKRKTVGCLLLVKLGRQVMNFERLVFSDPSGDVAQLARVDDVWFVNTHIRWAEEGAKDHIGVRQTALLLNWLGGYPAVLLADCNSRPGGRVRQQFADAGFTSVSGDEPTAFVYDTPAARSELAALDLLAGREVPVSRVLLDYSPESIPTAKCPSDHIPLLAEVGG